MKIALISKYADSLGDIGFRIGLEDHKVSLYIDDVKCRENFEGIIPKAKTWQECVRNADLVVFDDNKLSNIWEQVHKSIPCFGGSTFAKRLEDDRDFAHSIMERAGIEKNERKEFKTFKEVLKHLGEHQVPHAVKPSGSKVESHHVIIGRNTDNSDAISQVERHMAMGLQVDKIEVEETKFGTEVGLSFFFNGIDKVGPTEINFEHKRSHDGEEGYLTGEMGTLMRYLEDDENPLYTDTLKKMIPILRSADYRGQIDITCMVGEDEEGRFCAPLELTPRLGKPAVFLSEELHITPWADLFMACATGKSIDLRVHYDWCVGVMLCAFGFPFDDKVAKISKGLTIEGLDENTLEHIHMLQVSMKKGKFVVGEGNGWFLCSTGRGDTIEKAKEKAYEHLEPIKVPNSFKRKDISDKISPHELERLEILPYEESLA